ncbi:MAG: iron donor protein CyaY [SAR324 cluster bacterium]|nr:iron donor protein CyaY [SAR324 cluster bacterium]
MNMSEYLNLSGELFRNIEDKLDEFEDDIDYDKADGKIQVIFENGSSPLVINTQRAIHEVWLAGGARAWHFKWLDTEKKWFAEVEQEELYQCLARLIEERIQKTIDFHA